MSAEPSEESSWAKETKEQRSILASAGILERLSETAAQHSTVAEAETVDWKHPSAVRKLLALQEVELVSVDNHVAAD